MTSPESYTSYNEELKQLWGNKSFAYPIAAKVYEGTNCKLQDSPVIETKTFLHCIVEHLICNGQIKLSIIQIGVSVHVIDLLNTAPIRSHADDR